MPTDMTTPANASALYKNQINNIVSGPSVLTVGPPGYGADFTSVLDALGERNNNMPLWTKVSDFTGETNTQRGGRQIKQTAGTDFSAFTGRIMGLELQPGQGIFNCKIANPTNGWMEMPVQDGAMLPPGGPMALYTPNPVVIEILPGSLIVDTNSSGSQQIRANTIIRSRGRSAQWSVLDNTPSGPVLDISSGESNIVFQDFVLVGDAGANSAFLMRIGQHSFDYDSLMDTRFINMRIDHIKSEGIRAGSMGAGRIDFINCDISGVGINLSIPEAQQLNVIGGSLVSNANNSVNDVYASNIVLSSSGTDDSTADPIFGPDNLYGRSLNRIHGVSMRAYTRGAVNQTLLSANIYLSGGLHNTTVIDIAGNDMVLFGDGAPTADTAAILGEVLSVQSKSPLIYVRDNVFDVQSDTTGTLDAIRANGYTILETNNYGHSGTIVTKTGNVSPLAPI